MKEVLIGVTFLAVDCEGSSNLPIKTIEGEDDGNGYIQYYTNDPAYYKWVFDYKISNNTIMPTTLEIAIKKYPGVSRLPLELFFAIRMTQTIIRCLSHLKGCIEFNK